MSKEFIKQVKESNGWTSEKITQKDMWLYVVGKIDEIEHKLDKGANKIGTNRSEITRINTKINIVLALSSILFPLIITFGAWVVLRFIELAGG